MRVKLALRNLFISQAIIFIFLIFAYFIWFPYSFIILKEFYKTAILLIIVDLVLGPLLVLLVYKENKKHLRFDINILLLIQITAFAFGAYSLYLKHPVYAVFTIDRFTLVNAANANSEKIRFNTLKSSLFSKTKIAVAKMPVKIEERNALVLGVLNGEVDLDQRAEYYEPYDLHIKSVIDRNLITDVSIFKNKTKREFKKFINKHGGKISDYVYLPLQTQFKDVIWVLNNKTALPIGIIDIDPWSLNKKVLLSKK